MARQQDNNVAFKSVVLFKDQTLGMGSYGAVCKAKCDDLVCAAKIIHPTLLDPLAQIEIAPHRQHRLPIKRFEQEIEFLSSIRHPNIILYLGMHQDTESGLPVLLMELMDESLTRFLESSKQPIPYHIEVNICHDIALALSFLHSNNIIHRDLSSNNVLLRGKVLAKVTDFGMAKFSKENPHLTNTVCPGTDMYMPPEAVDEKAMYTEKIDCFSFGVIVLQMLTRLFPKPGDRMKTINDPRYPRAIKMNVPEIERREEHIRIVDPNHPLLAVVMDCLKDEERDRPSAKQLCERMAALKESEEYRDASERTRSCGNEQVQHRREDVQTLQDQLEANVTSLQQKDVLIAIGEQNLRKCKQENQKLTLENVRINEDIQRLKIDKNKTIQDREKQLSCVNYQLEETKKVTADFERRVVELERQLRHRDEPQIQCDNDRSGAVSKIGIKMRWREGEKAPCAMDRWCDAVIGENKVYCVQQESGGQAEIHAYNTTTSDWSFIPPCPSLTGFAIAIVNKTLTTVGGVGALAGHDWNDTNKLFSLTGTEEVHKKGWTEEFPPMPTARRFVSALCTGSALIVAGGMKGTSSAVQTVEVLDTSTRQWYTATELPQPLGLSSITICGDQVYLLGGCDEDRNCTNSVYSCSLTTLLMSVSRAKAQSSDVWTRVSDIPVSHSTAVSLHGHVIAIGGKDSSEQCNSAIHQYNPSTNSWEVISHMTTPRSDCLTVVLPNNQLIVVGGFIVGYDLKTDLVEFAICS